MILKDIEETFGSLEDMLANRKKFRTPEAIYSAKYRFIRNPKLHWAEKVLINIKKHFKGILKVDIDINQFIK